MVRAAAALSGVPANLIDRTGGVSMRVTADGTSMPVAESVDPSWPRAVTEDGAVEIVLERSAPNEAHLDALVAERALLAIATAIGRPDEARPRDENLALRTVVDAKATPKLRHQALERLGLTPETEVCVVAVRGAAPVLAIALAEAREKAGSRRAGIGQVLPADEAPLSWKRAWSALALTSEGTRADPGDRIVLADDAGALLWLVEHLSPGAELPDDVTSVTTHAASAPWLLETLEAISTNDSVRDAAAALGLHHSTVQERSARASRLLGWDITDQRGKHRTQLALAIRRIGNAQRTNPAPQ
ncbi:helix-turn-helix domain-containing protein [Agromyces salentinus]|uniref:helix-turn-helix domain-containing protein n=1 Tax=Agromyces salentinus TaxID=269421 RepID=UPI0014791146|nr:helix-turn-helix domain-containing protein [Agromyces salentinus]